MRFYVEYEDKDLLVLMKDDDENAFSEIYYRYWKPLYLLAYKIVDDEAVCNDVVQDIFVWLWGKRAKHAINSLKFYLHTAIKRDAACKQQRKPQNERL